MRMVVDSRLCSGCMICETVCSLHRTERCSGEVSLIKIHRKELISTFHIRHCVTCHSRACLGACVSQAIRLEASLGIVHVDPDRCLHCGSCVKACPDGSTL